MDSESIDKSFTIAFRDVLADILPEVEHHSRPHSLSKSRSPLNEEVPKVSGVPEYRVAETKIAHSHASATLSTIQPLGDNKSLLVMTITCHPEPGRRFVNATIDCKVSAPSSSQNEIKTHDPKIIMVAPRDSKAGLTEEKSGHHLGLSVPAQGLTSIGVLFGPSAEKETETVIKHAMTITGSIQGTGGAAHAIWTVVENESSKRGIPSYFQLAIVLDHIGPFVLELDVEAKLGGNLLSRGLQKIKGSHTNAKKTIVDVETWKCGDILWKADEWVKYVADFTGEVDGLTKSFSQEIVRP